MKDKEIVFTVFTPTYNRAHLLQRVYESLKQQTFRDFEWIVVDDGSADNTPELIAQWEKEADFPIRYIRQPNNGKHVAINRGVSEARGFLFVIIDSDDWFVPNALERLFYHWQIIPEAEKSSFAGVAGLFSYPDGQVVGDVFPQPVWISNMMDRWAKWRIRGDKMECFRTDVLKAHPFPENVGKFVPEGVVWNEIGYKYKTLYFNEVIACKEYQPDGLSAKGVEFAIRTAFARWIYFKKLCKILDQRDDLPWAFRLRSYVSYTRFALHARIPINKQIMEAPSKTLWMLALPVGMVVCIWDYFRIARDNQR